MFHFHNSITYSRTSSPAYDIFFLPRNLKMKHKKRLKEFETYSKLTFLKQYDSNEYIKRFVVTEDDPVADFFQDDESNRVNVLPHDRSKLQKFIAMHLPHNNTGPFNSIFNGPFPYC